jgi:hypothetical protein
LCEFHFFFPPPNHEDTFEATFETADLTAFDTFDTTLVFGAVAGAGVDFAELTGAELDFVTFELVEDDLFELELELDELEDPELVKGFAAGWNIAGSDEDPPEELLEVFILVAACACGAVAAILCFAPEELV